MSLLKLGGISVTSLNEQIPTFYVASVIHSQSGFIYPKLVKTVDELDTFFESNFKYYNMYRDLILNNIPILLIPIYTKSSEYNRCSLRLTESTEFPYCYPNILTDYEYEDYHEAKDNVESDSLISRLIKSDSDLSEYNYGYLLDFSNVDFSSINPSNYFFIFGSNKLDDVAYYNMNIMVWIKDSESDQPPVTTTDANSIIEVNYTQSSDMNELVTDIKNKLNSSTLCYVTDIDDYLIHVNGGDSDNLNDGILTTYFSENPIPFSYSDFDSSSEFSDYESYLNYYSKPYIDELVKYVASDFSGIVSNSILSNRVNTILSNILNNADIQSFDNILELFTNEWLTNDFRLENKLKLLVSYFFDPGKNLNFFDLDGFKITPVTEFTQDKFCSFTQNDRTIEFYSRIKGEEGSKIKIEIEKLFENKNRYEVKISKDNYQEYYLIDTDLGDTKLDKLLSERDFDSYYDETEFKPLSELNTSRLVDVYIYDYKLYNGMRIRRADYEDYPEYINGELIPYLTPEIVNDPMYDDEGHVTNPYYGLDCGEVSVNLIEGTYELDRYITEEWDYTDEINTYNLISEYEYFPDLIICDNLDEFSETDEIVSNLIKLAKDTYSQVLIELDENLVNNYNISNSESRVLYFYGDLSLNENSYGTYYPYIRNLINSDYIKRVRDSILYRNDIDESILDSKGINYLLYNNLYYNYNRLKEFNNDPDFIIRFNTSKISRLFMNNQHLLMNVERDEFKKTIDSIISLASNLLPLVDSINYKHTDEENLQVIELEVKLTPIVNKTFILNINLNS